MTTQEVIRKVYTQRRNLGEPSRWALMHARTIVEWESVNGHVTYNKRDQYHESHIHLRIVPDDIGHTIDDLAGDCFNPKANPDITPSRLERERKAFIERVERDGVVGIVGEYRLDPESEWIHVDSCWGFVGDDWKNSGYDMDIMRATLDAYNAARLASFGDIEL